MGIYVFVVQMRWIAVVRIGICRIGTMRCIVFTLTLALSHQGRGDSVGCVVLVVAPCPFTSGLRIKSAMTGPG